MRTFKLAIMATSALFMAPQLVVAQETQDQGARQGKDVIVVTATKREQNIQDIPFTVLSISEQAIQDSGAYDFSGLVDQFSGVEFRTAQPGQGAISIRGIAELNTANINGGTGAAVGLYVDEAPLTIAGLIPQAVLFDLNRVEVLKGPQGTLFGEGSLAGTVRLITNKPDSQAFDAKIDGTYGSIKDGGSNYLVNAMLNIPLIEDRLAFRGVGFYYDQGGWIDRIDPTVTAGIDFTSLNPLFPPSLGLPAATTDFSAGTITPDANSSETHGGRGQLRLDISDDFSVTASALIMESERGIRNQGSVDRVLTVSTDFEGAEDELQQYNLVIEKDFGIGSILASTTYLNREIVYTTDQIGLVSIANNFGMLGLAAMGPPATFEGLRADFDVDTEDLSQEVRFVSDFGGPLEVTAGMFYRKRDFTFDFTTPAEPAIPALIFNVAVGGPLFTEAGEGDVTISAVSKTRQIAGFGEATYALSDRLELLFGARLFNEERTSDSTAFGVFSGVIPAQSFSTGADETIFTPRASLSYDVSDEVSTYFTYSQGFRSGGQNDLNSLVAAVDLESYNSERLRSYELGVKSTMLDGALVFNVAGFLNQWRDLQVVLAEGPGGAGEVIGNAGDARSYGVDIEAVAEPLEGLTLTAAASIIETDIQDSVLTVPNPLGVGADVPVPLGTDIPDTAEQQISLTGVYRKPINHNYTGMFHASFAYVSDSLSSLTAISGTTPEPAIQSGYTLVDLRAGIEADHWALSIFANNVFDDDASFGTRGGSTALDAVTGDISFIQGPPRTIGVNLRLNM